MPEKDLVTGLVTAATWKNVGSRLWGGFTRPFGSIGTFSFFIVVVFLAGGLGIWFPMFTYKPEIISYRLTLAAALATYYLAIIAMLFGDLTYTVFQRLVSKDVKTRPSTEVGMWFVVSMILAFLLAAACVSLTRTEQQVNLAFTLSLVGFVVSLIVWWTLNGESNRYSEVVLDTYYNAEKLDDKIEGEGVRDGNNTI
jgi:hypothetical protein